MTKKPAADVIDPNNDGEAKQTCGIIMPIAGNELYEASHWQRVRLMLNEAIEQAGFTPKIVSDADEVSVIHGSIVQNIYDNPIVVCDVSSRNPNVMFELGMRLAFDKPTIIIKDEKTSYSFDTQVIEHIPYGSDLRFDDVREFQAKLAAKIKATVAKKQEDDNYSPFLKHFKHLVPQKLGSQEVSVSDFLFAKINEMQNTLLQMSINQPRIFDFRVKDEKSVDAALNDMISLMRVLAKPDANLSKEAMKPTVLAIAHRERPTIPAENLEKLFNLAWRTVVQEKSSKPSQAMPNDIKVLLEGSAADAVDKK